MCGLFSHCLSVGCLNGYTVESALNLSFEVLFMFLRPCGDSHQADSEPSQMLGQWEGREGKLVES